MSTSAAPVPEGPSGVGEGAPSALQRVFGALRAIPVVWYLTIVLWVWIAAINPLFAEPSGFLAYLKQAAPLAILAAGAFFVLASGEFDLSVGSLVTVCVVVAAAISDGDPSKTWPVIALLFVIGLIVGLINGVVTTIFRVPSFITTLAMLLILDGAVWLYTSGSPKGALADNFREIGRMGIEVPVIDQLPYSVIILVAIGAFSAWLMRRHFGRQVLAVGDNDRAAALSGINVTRVRITAFVLSALSAVIAGILLGGFAGVTAQVGQGLEFEAITAAVLGGTVLGGGRGSVINAMAGALALTALFSWLNLQGVSGAFEDAVEGVIIIAAVAVASYRLREGS